jgi:hypothetical protein
MQQHERLEARISALERALQYLILATEYRVRRPDRDDFDTRLEYGLELVEWEDTIEGLESARKVLNANWRNDAET